MSRVHSTLAALGAIALLAAIAPPAWSTPAVSETPELVVVLDSSGSMAEADAGGGQTRMDAAKQAVVALATSAPDGARIGLRTYGDGVDSQAPGSCEDTTLRVPVGPVDREALTAQVQQLAPRGDTPIGVSLRAAATDLTGSGPRSIVLVSDGEPTCDPDPCVVAGELAAQGVDLRVDVVGFRVGEEARRILQCVADAGGGTYVDAADAGDLTEALDTSLNRGFRVYRPEGTPVEGTTTPEGAPLVEEGQYLDSIEVGVPKHYLVDVPAGWTMRFGYTLTRGDDPERRGVKGMLVSWVKTDASDPAPCATALDSPDNARGTAPFSGGILTGPQTWRYANDADRCERGGPLLVMVEWKGSSADEPVAMEVVVDLEAPVTGEGALGQEGDETTVFPELQPLADPAPVDGGSSFNDARLLGEGAHSDSMRVGETVFYRVPLDWGQQLALRVDFPPTVEGSALDEALSRGNYANVLVFDATRGHAYPIGTKSKRYAEMRDEGGYLAVTTHPVVWANRTNGVYNELRTLSRPGDFFIMLSMDGDTTSADAEGLAVPYTVSIDVLGEAQAGPTYSDDEASQVAASTPPPANETSESAAPAATPEPAPSPSVEAAPPAQGGGLLLPGLLTAAGLLVAALVALVVFGVRRSRTDPAGDGAVDPYP